MENILYVIGDKGTDKLSLVKKLLANVREEDEQEKILRIDTKYYSSDVKIQEIDLIGSEYIDPINIIQSNNSSNVVILTFHDQVTFDSVREFVEQLLKARDGGCSAEDEEEEEDESTPDPDKINIESESILIIVEFNHSTNDIKNKAEIENWCREIATEYIISDLDLHKSYELEKLHEDERLDSDLERIKFGHERIKEILETTLWSHMNQKQFDKKKPQPSNNNDNNNNNNNNNNITNIITEEISRTEQDKIKKSGHEQKGEQMNQSVFESMKKVEEFFKLGNVKKNEEEEESDEMDILENTFKELNVLRDQLKHLPDKDRQNAAAKIALMFAKSLDDMGGDDEDLDDDFNDILNFGK